MPTEGLKTCSIKTRTAGGAGPHDSFFCKDTFPQGKAHSQSKLWIPLLTREKKRHVRCNLDPSNACM
jgi:hypothetical protein